MRNLFYLFFTMTFLISCNNNNIKEKELELKEKELEMKEMELSYKDSINSLIQSGLIEKNQENRAITSKEEEVKININSLPFIGTVTLCDKSMTIVVSISKDGYVKCKREDTEEEGWEYFLEGKWNENGIIKDNNLTLKIDGKHSMKLTDRKNNISWWFNPCRN